MIRELIIFYQFVLSSGFIDKLVEAEARAFKQQDESSPRIPFTQTIGSIAWGNRTQYVCNSR